MERGGVKRPHSDESATEGGPDGGEPEATVTMVDVLREQRALEQEARERMLEGWGDESRCTYGSVGTLASRHMTARGRTLTV